MTADGSMVVIDPVEAALAVIGLQPILSKEVERVTMEQAREMANLPRKIYNTAKGVVRGEAANVPLSTINYKRTLDQLTEEWNEGQVIAMVSKFPPVLHAITSDFVIEADKVVQFLKSIFPIQKKTSFAGAAPIPPSAMAVSRFTTAYNIIDDPTRVLTHIACGSLLKSQTLAVQQIYPTITEAISDAFASAIEYELTQKKSFTVPARVQMGLSVWHGLPRFPQRLQNRLQQNFATANEQKPEPPKSTDGTAQSIVSKEALTSTQRALYPSTSKAS